MTDEQLLEWLYSDIDEAIDFEYKEKEDEQTRDCRAT